MRLVFLCSLISTLLLAGIETHPIPRMKTSHYLNEGILVGGTYNAANLESIRFSSHKAEGYERFVFDFSDTTSRNTGKTAPKFQVRYVKPPKVEMSTGAGSVVIPPKFIFSFQRIKQNYLERETIKKISQKSRFIKDIVLYPSIENGDMAIEFILKDQVIFEAHQPRDKEGRLVLDLKNAPL